MITEIGFVAGDIWKLLDEKGRLEFSKLVKQSPHSEELTLMALGWLCREGHVVISQQSAKTFVELRAAKEQFSAKS